MNPYAERACSTRLPHSQDLLRADLLLPLGAYLSQPTGCPPHLRTFHASCSSLRWRAFNQDRAMPLGRRFSAFNYPHFARRVGSRSLYRSVVPVRARSPCFRVGRRRHARGSHRAARAASDMSLALEIEAAIVAEGVRVGSVNRLPGV